MEAGVFQRKFTKNQASELLSARQYNVLIGGILLWGFVINWLMVKYIPVQIIENVNVFVFLIGYFASCFYGIHLFKKSSNPWVSFIGYNFVVIPFGLVINIVVSQYDPLVVLDAIAITGLVTVLMMVLGAIFPQFFEKIAGVLFLALLSVCVLELVEVLIFKMHHDVIDWIVAIIFCGYIGYDWNRANKIPKTIDNAVDSAAAIYIDIINLFLRILRILGRGKRRR